MKDKLTLRLDSSLIAHAKKQAKEKGTSVSQMVSDYFKALKSEKSKGEKVTIPPKTASLTGILQKDLDKGMYKKHLEKKHLS